MYNNYLYDPEVSDNFKRLADLDIGEDVVHD